MLSQIDLHPPPPFWVVPGTTGAPWIRSRLPLSFPSPPRSPHGGKCPASIRLPRPRPPHYCSRSCRTPLRRPPPGGAVAGHPQRAAAASGPTPRRKGRLRAKRKTWKSRRRRRRTVPPSGAPGGRRTRMRSARSLGRWSRRREVSRGGGSSSQPVGKSGRKERERERER